MVAKAHRSTLPLAQSPGMLLVGIASAVAIRTALAGPQKAGSLFAAVIFSMGILALGIAAGWRPTWSTRRVGFGVVMGVIGGAVLIAFPLLRSHTWHIGPVAPSGALATWSLVVVIVAVSEEVIFRGVLFNAVQRHDTSGSALVAVCVTSIAFALVHLPLYGSAALPLDFAVGLLLGGLRLVSGTVVAPACAHALADLSMGWIVV